MRVRRTTGKPGFNGSWRHRVARIKHRAVMDRRTRLTRRWR